MECEIPTRLECPSPKYYLRVYGTMIEKLLVPSILFLLLSPGLLQGGTTSFMEVFLRALVLVAMYWGVSRALGLSLTKADLIVPAVLFVLLSPGILLTLPPGPGGVVFMSGNTNSSAVVIHTLVFACVFGLLRRVFPKVY